MGCGLSRAAGLAIATAPQPASFLARPVAPPGKKVLKRLSAKERMFAMSASPTRRLLPLAPLTLLLAGCATFGVGDRQMTSYSPAGQALRVVAANGAASFMQFRPDGVVTAQFNSRQIAGRWNLEGRNLCFQWPGATRECWPYYGPFPRNRPVSITSSRGNTVQVTRQ